MWNDKTEQFETSFRAYIRHETEDKDEKSMFEFDFKPGENDVVMTSENHKVFVVLGVCALMGGIVAGFIIRYLMRMYFPAQEE